MKKTSKIAAMAAAMALAATLAVPSMMMSASAATENTVTITSEQGTSSAKTHSYKAYKIFGGEVADSQLKNITFGGSDFSAFLTALKADTTIGSDFTSVTDVAGVAAQLATYTNDSAEAKAFAKFVAMNTDKVAAAVESSTTEGSENTIPLTTDGYYVIIEDVPADTQTDFAITSYILAQYDASEGADINAKSTVPTVDKQVLDETDDAEEGSTDGWGETADHAINETFQFKLIGTLTADAKYDDYLSYKMVFHDTLNKGITYDGGVAATVKFGTGDARTLTIAAEKIVSSTDATTGVTTLTITIDDLKAALTGTEKLSDGAVVTITYNAHLNADAALTAGNAVANTGYDNVNGVYLEYSNNPNYTGSGTPSTGNTPNDHVWVFTYSVDNVKKKDSTSGDNLAGAKFKLFTTKTAGTGSDPDTYSGEVKLIDNNDGTYTVANQTATTGFVTEMVSAATTGIFNIKGLDTGTYYLVETEAPSGYKVADTVEVVISATHAETDTTGSAAQVTMEAATKNMSNTVVDTSGSTLPSTGGMGTKLFIVCGSLTAAAAGIYLVSKKRAKDETEE